MAYNSTPSSITPLQVKRSTSFGQPNPTTSLFIDKSKAHIRQATPDSEALASSDDEQELHRVASHSAPRVIRRPSWLSETNSARKSSHGASDAVSPASVWELGSGSNNLARSNSNATYNPWGGSIWNNDQRNPPARLSELKNIEKQQGQSHSTDESILSPGHRRESNADGSAIPFAIPLQPTIKNYRSQSYSVGQSEDEANNNPLARNLQGSYATRGRTTTGFALTQHRPIRPSLLSGDFSPENSTVLEQVREVADDDEGNNGSSEAGLRLPSSSSRTMEQVAMENILRQSHQHPSTTATQRSSSFSTHGPQLQRYGNARGPYTQESVLEEVDGDSYGSGVASHASDPSAVTSDVVSMLTFQSFTSATTIENRALENVKKGHWSSSLGFGGLPDIPQSRRHSFADAPIRNQSHATQDLGQMVGNAQAFAYADANGRMHGDNSKLIDLITTILPAATACGTDNLQRVVELVSFFSAIQQHPRSNEAFRPSSSGSSIHQGYGGISQSPTPQLTNSLQPPMQSLYLVTFKAARAEFYYVHEGTGLEVNAGDLVIVEADRGTDLGTVAHKNLDWVTAKELKEKYAVDHYNWLMLFSRQKQGGQVSPPGSSAGRPFGSAVGGMRPHPSNPPPDNGEIKPKMIKRLAQQHEIHMLREKEGNEAKAKRMCQQKVAEHHLNMEILDAEFQMDWKKLTFYYYADTYVNFNNLVTDLFKAYKTRIWMSAINPDSFATPVPPGMVQIARRERPNPEGNNMLYSPMSDMQQSFGAWPSQQESMPASSAYSHFFTNSGPQSGQVGYNNMPMMQQDYSRNIYPGYRMPSPTSMQQQYGAGGRGQGGTNGLYDGQDSGTGYQDQLKALQGLSLGS